MILIENSKFIKIARLRRNFNNGFLLDQLFVGWYNELTQKFIPGHQPVIDKLGSKMNFFKKKDRFYYADVMFIDVAIIPKVEYVNINISISKTGEIQFK